MLPACAVLHEKVRNKKGSAHVHDGMGTPVRPFGIGTPDMPGVLLFVLSCILYGIAFDFYNIAGSIYVEQNVDKSIRASAQGLFMMMSNGIGATLGLMCAGSVMDHYVFKAAAPDWSSAWFIFAGYMLVVTILFGIVFRESKK